MGGTEEGGSCILVALSSQREDSSPEVVAPAVFFGAAAFAGQALLEAERHIPDYVWDFVS